MIELKYVLQEEFVLLADAEFIDPIIRRKNCLLEVLTLVKSQES